jgi:hypothetical protein
MRSAAAAATAATAAAADACCGMVTENSKLPLALLLLLLQLGYQEHKGGCEGGRVRGDC